VFGIGPSLQKITATKDLYVIVRGVCLKKHFIWSGIIEDRGGETIDKVDGGKKCFNPILSENSRLCR